MNPTVETSSKGRVGVAGAGRFNRRLHRIRLLSLTLFTPLGETFKQMNSKSVYVIDTFLRPMGTRACNNYRIRRSRRYQGEAYRGRIAGKKRYFYGLKPHLLITAQAEPIESFLTPGSCADVAGSDFFDSGRSRPGHTTSRPTIVRPSKRPAACWNARCPSRFTLSQPRL